jgi:phosphatidylinositol-3-phosphatase
MAEPGSEVTEPTSEGSGVTATQPPSGYDHVGWVVMENHSFDDVIGSSDAPFINKLADQFGLATDFFAEAHPSLPNYIAMTSGSTQGITDDGPPADHQLQAPSIFSLLPGGGSRSLQESMPSNCFQTDSGEYAVRHNPQAYYVNLGGDCANFNVPLAIRRTCRRGSRS